VQAVANGSAGTLVVPHRVQPDLGFEYGLVLEPPEVALVRGPRSSRKLQRPEASADSQPIALFNINQRAQ
jgi:hypothetical protein